MKFKINKTIFIWFIIIVSVLVLGTQAALYFRVARIPVLNTDLPAGKQITSDMVTYIDVNPNAGFMGNIITDQSGLFRDGVAGKNGKYTLVPLFKGQPIDSRSITGSLTDSQFGIGARIEDANHVAITVLIPLQNAAGLSFATGEKVNLTYALGSGQALAGQSITIDKNTLRQIDNVQVLDIRNENGLKILDNTVSTGKYVMLTLSVPKQDSGNIVLAASGQGVVYLTLSSVSAQAGSGVSSPTQNTPTAPAMPPSANNTAAIPGTTTTIPPLGSTTTTP
jgi:Flp pilus assembly protein CpaB